MKRALSVTDLVWKRKARERSLSLHGYTLTAGQKKAENPTELGEELENQKNRAWVKLGKNTVLEMKG